MYWHSGKIFSNFLKFSQIFSNFLEFSRSGGGVPDRGGLSQTFVVFDFLGEKLSQIFQILSECIFLYWRYAGEILPQIFQSCARTFFFSLDFFNISYQI